MSLDLFSFGSQGERTALGPQAFLLHEFALTRAESLLREVQSIVAQAAFRHMMTPGGRTMSVALTNCGPLGWTTNARGYCYSATDPETGRPWPALPPLFLDLAADAAGAAGFKGFVPDACLVNRYAPGARMSLHQDKDEQDQTSPIVSVSLGMPATFLFGGHARSDRAARVPLKHGDVVVWGGVDRMRYHGVLPVNNEPHPQLGSERINFTFRKVR